MLIYKYKCDGKTEQYQAIEEAIKVTQFIRSLSLLSPLSSPGKLVLPVAHVSRDLF